MHECPFERACFRVSFLITTSTIDYYLRPSTYYLPPLPTYLRTSRHDDQLNMDGNLA